MTEQTVEPSADTCKRNHPRTPENTTVRPWRGPDGIERVIRQCRICARQAAATRKERKAAAASAPVA